MSNRSRASTLLIGVIVSFITIQAYIRMTWVDPLQSLLGSIPVFGLMLLAIIVLLELAFIGKNIIGLLSRGQSPKKVIFNLSLGLFPTLIIMLSWTKFSVYNPKDTYYSIAIALNFIIPAMLFVSYFLQKNQPVALEYSINSKKCFLLGLSIATIGMFFFFVKNWIHFEETSRVLNILLCFILPALFFSIGSFSKQKENTVFKFLCRAALLVETILF